MKHPTWELEKGLSWGGFCSVEAEVALASMFSWDWGSHTKSPLSAPASGVLVLPQAINLPVKTFRNSSLTLTHECAGVPFVVKFYFILLGRGGRGRRRILT
jgi:hypothetical protein